MVKDNECIKSVDDILENISKIVDTVKSLCEVIPNHAIQFRNDVSLRHSSFNRVYNEEYDALFKPVDTVLKRPIRHYQVEHILLADFPEGTFQRTSYLKVVVGPRGTVYPLGRDPIGLRRTFKGGEITFDHLPSGSVILGVRIDLPENPPETIRGDLRNRSNMCYRTVIGRGDPLSNFGTDGIEPFVENALSVWCQTKEHRLPSLDDFT